MVKETIRNIKQHWFRYLLATLNSMFWISILISCVNFNANIYLIVGIISPLVIGIFYLSNEFVRKLYNL